MANEIAFTAPTGLQLYYMLRKNGTYWNGTTYATFTTTRSTWWLPMSEVTGTGLYRGSLPSAGASAGQVEWEVMQQASGTDASTSSHANDIQLGVGGDYWDGSKLGGNALADAIDGVSGGGSGAASVLNDTTVATVTSQTVLTLTAGSSVNGAYVNQSIVLYDVSNSNFPSVRKCTAYTGSTRTLTLETAPDFTFVAGDGVKIFVAPTIPTPKQITVQVGGQ